jgi:hypothetical protein
MGSCVPDWSGLGWGKMKSSCECGDELSGSIEYWEIIE